MLKKFFFSVFSVMCTNNLKCMPNSHISISSLQCRAVWLHASVLCQLQQFTLCSVHREVLLRAAFWARGGEEREEKTGAIRSICRCRGMEIITDDYTNYVLVLTSFSVYSISVTKLINNTNVFCVSLGDLLYHTSLWNITSSSARNNRIRVCVIAKHKHFCMPGLYFGDDRVM